MLSKNTYVYEIPKHSKEFGKGCWLAIHILAYNAKRIEDQKNFCLSVRVICSNLPCMTCRKHSTEYIESNPPEQYISSDVRAMFKWSSDLHNNANKITKYPLLDWKVMYTKYEENNKKEPEICEGDCISGSQGAPSKTAVSVVEKKPQIVNKSPVGRPIGISPVGMGATIYNKLKNKQKYGIMN